MTVTEKYDVDRDVILDLFPVYLAGEASPATRVLVEEFLRRDTELALKLKQQWAEGFSTALPFTVSPELELRTLKRIRKLITLQSWLLGFAIASTMMAFSFGFSITEREDGSSIRSWPRALAQLEHAWCWECSFGPATG
jgi:hypothetical protein